MTNSIRIVEHGMSNSFLKPFELPSYFVVSDGVERQIIKDMDGNMPRPKIRACSISDPFVLVLREDDSIGLFIGETERGKIRRKDMSPMGDKVSLHFFLGIDTALIIYFKTSRYIAGAFFMDVTGILDTDAPPNNAAGKTTLQNVMNAGNRSQWLILVRPQGIMEVCS